MDVKKRQLKAAANEGIISAEQSEALYEFLSHQSQSTPIFNSTHTLCHSESYWSLERANKAC